MVHCILNRLGTNGGLSRKTICCSKKLEWLKAHRANINCCNPELGGLFSVDFVYVWRCVVLLLFSGKIKALPC